MTENPIWQEGHKNIEDVLKDAKRYAVEMGAEECTTVHLLLAVENDPVVQMGFRRQGVDRESLRKSCEFFFGTNENNSTMQPDALKFSPRVNLVLKELNTHAERNRLPTTLDLALKLIDQNFEGQSQFVYQGAINKPWERKKIKSGNIVRRFIRGAKNLSK